jgi:lipopolysaccharide/colanic/teichoic acid biosynthesis glycosyltransferase
MWLSGIERLADHRLQLPSTRLSTIGGSDSRTKRLVDVVLASVGLAISAPVLVVSAIAVVLDSPGPPLFLQERSGQYGRPFRVCKLRTMVVDAARVGPQLTQTRDPRITRVGRFLRRTSIDELPQLWNVIVGEMSLVGPRPDLPSITARYTEKEREVLQYRPGITGISQITGRAALSIQDKLALDIGYYRHSTLWSDFVIILKTPAAVVFNRGNIM